MEIAITKELAADKYSKRKNKNTIRENITSKIKFLNFIKNPPYFETPDGALLYLLCQLSYGFGQFDYTGTRPSGTPHSQDCPEPSNSL